MFIYSVSVGIFYIKSWQAFRACMRFELCAPSFSLLPFLAAISFWLIVLYVPIMLALKPQTVFEQIRGKWWIAFPILALAIGHGLVRTVEVIHSLENFDLIASDIFFCLAMVVLLPWFFLLLLKFFRWSEPTLLTMFIYSIAVTNAAFRPWVEGIIYSVVSKVTFSVPLFLGEVVMWFVALYILMKLILRMERQGAS